MVAVSAVVASAVLVTGDLGRGWDLFGVPRMPPPYRTFTDTISVTHAADCVSIGRDPYVDTRCDPWKRLFNYPPSWVELRRIGASAQTTNVLGAAIAALFSAALVLAFRASSRIGSLIVLSALLSPAILFGLERGNVDTVLFSLLAFGLFATRGLSGPWQSMTRGGLIIALTALKAYPIAACAALANHRRASWWVALLTGGVAFLAFVGTSWGRIPSIFGNTPFTSYYSYGAGALFLDLAAWADTEIASRTELRAFASAVAVLMGVAVAVWVFLKPSGSLHRFLPPLTDGDFTDDLCLAGLSIFCLTFLLGTNFNYRLIFLAGAIPVLIRAFEQSRDARFLIFSGAVIALLWAVRLPDAVAHVLGWLVYLAACAWLAQALLARRGLATACP